MTEKGATRVLVRDNLGRDRLPGDHSYGVEVLLDGVPLRGVKHVSVDMDAEEFAIVSVAFVAEVEVDIQLRAIAVIDPATEAEVLVDAAEAVARIATKAARRNYLQVRET